jgi:adenine-specific DNA-methyltransferase
MIETKLDDIELLERVKILKQNYPEIVDDYGKIVHEKLCKLVNNCNQGENKFNWKGKQDCIREANEPSLKTLRPCKEESKDWDTTENLYIEGDNLEVLKLLQKSYFGKIDMIYIDPPYNTGKNFVYKDNYNVSKKDVAKDFDDDTILK